MKERLADLQAQYFLLVKEVYTKVGIKQLMSDECVFVKFVSNIKGVSISPEGICEKGVFEHLSFQTPWYEILL